MDHVLAAAETGLRVFPLVPLSKRPALKDWPELASSDPLVILQWWKESPQANYGVVTGPVNDLFVIDLDGAEALSWWAGQDFPQGAVVSTPSGGKHIYYRTENTEIQTNQSKIHPKVDIRGWNGYVVGPGSMLPTGSYAGDLTSIPDAPDELLEIIPERQTYDSSEFVGEQVESATTSEERQVANVVKRLLELPAVWSEGAGWRSTCYQMACWLARMVNSPAYAMTEDAALTILLTHTPINSEWGDDKIIEQWQSARKSTAGQYADLPAEQQPTFLSVTDVPTPELTSKGRAFTDLLFHLPEVNSNGARWDRRHTILVEAFRAGLDDLQAASLAWGSQAGLVLQLEPQAATTLWREVTKAKKAAAKLESKGATAPADEDRPPLVEEATLRIDLLTRPERKLVESVDYRWWGDRYLDWAEESVSVMNAPYHRMNRWTIVSLVFAPWGCIPLAGGIDVGLNLYQMVLGDTTTGKSESVKLLRSVLRAYYATGEMPDIGGDATPNALVEKLIERDGKSSWFNRDEAHGQIAEMKSASYLRGLTTALTLLYDGEVPMMLRASKKDVSGVDATTFFTIHYMATLAGMSEVIEGSDWESGWMNRFVWAIGEKSERTRDSMRLKLRGSTEVESGKKMQEQWAAEFRRSEDLLDMMTRNGTEMRFDPAVIERHLDLKVKLFKMVASHRYASRLLPTFERLSMTILKCACLVALTESSDFVTMRHLLIAINQGEEWATNIVTMVNMTDETPLVRDVNRLERYIAAQPGRELALARVYGVAIRSKRGTDELLEELKAQGRVVASDDAKTIKIQEREAA